MPDYQRLTEESFKQFCDWSRDRNIVHDASGVDHLNREIWFGQPEARMKGPIAPRFQIEGILEGAYLQTLPGGRYRVLFNSMPNPIYGDVNIAPEMNGGSASLKEEGKVKPLFVATLSPIEQMALEGPVMYAHRRKLKREYGSPEIARTRFKPTNKEQPPYTLMKHEVLTEESYETFRQLTRQEDGARLSPVALAALLVETIGYSMHTMSPYHLMRDPPAFTTHDLTFDTEALEDARKDLVTGLRTYSFLLPVERLIKMTGIHDDFPFGVVDEKGRMLVSGELSVIPLRQAMMTAAKLAARSENRKKVD